MLADLTWDDHVTNVMEELLDEAAEDENFGEHEMMSFFEEHADVFNPAVVEVLLDSTDPEEQWIGAGAACWLNDPAWIPALCALYRSTDDEMAHETARWAVACYDDQILIWNDFFDALAAYARMQMPAPGTLVQMSLF